MPKLSRRSIRYLRGAFQANDNPGELEWTRIVQEVQKLESLLPDACEAEAKAQFERARRLEAQCYGKGRVLSHSEAEEIEIAKKSSHFPSLTMEQRTALSEYVRSGKSSAQTDRESDLDHWRQLHYPSMDLGDALAFVKIFRKLRRRLTWVYMSAESSSPTLPRKVDSSKRLNGLATPITSSSQASSPVYARSPSPSPPLEMLSPRNLQEFLAFIEPHMATFEKLLSTTQPANGHLVSPSLFAGIASGGQSRRSVGD